MLNQSLFFKIAVIATLLPGQDITQDASAQSTETEATRLLKQRSAEFEREVIRVTDGVYTAVGYSVQPVSMIVGDEGIIIIDTGMDTTSAEMVLREFRKITDKPVKGIILTHSHGDHTGGLPVFAREGKTPIWARDNFDEESDALESVGLTIQYKRGARQGGFKLPPDKRINNGIAKAYYPQRAGRVFGSSEAIKPTCLLTEGRKEIKIAGVMLHLVAVTGETHDAIYVWYPSNRVLFCGDNYYKSWPNLYAIRGTPYRDINAWANAVDKMLKEEPDFLVPGHTRPIAGKDAIRVVLTDYRDAIRFVFEKTVEGMNKGLTPDELVEFVQLPERFRSKDHLRPYYGNPEWAVRSIFNGHLGWFDGNPSNLFPLSPKEEARRVAALAGGEDVLLARARAALKKEDFQWVAQLCDHLLALDPSAKEPTLIKADALEAIAQNVLSGIGRNYYLTVAQELRQNAEEDAPADADQPRR
jgi:alkyl sulfatase BDS1-like metallo-beta-lactamase superfamily hydrolase